MMIGIDFGGMKIEGVVLDERGTEHGRRRIATPRDDYDQSIAAIRDLVSGLEASLGGPVSFGVGIPGAISPVTGLVKNANSTWLNGRSLRDDLETALGRSASISSTSLKLRVNLAYSQIARAMMSGGKRYRLKESWRIDPA